MPNYNQRYAFITATPLDPVLGSGTAVAILGLLAALDKKGKKIGLITPPVLPLPAHTARWWFNRHVPGTMSGMEIDAAIGFDCDGYRFAARPRSCHYAAYLHGVIADEAANERGGIRRRLMREARWERQNCDGADLVIVPSAYSKARAATLYGVPERKIAVIPNGIDIDNWPQRRPPEHDRPRVLCVAKMYPRKGIDDLIEAWVEVHRAVPEAQLRIVGDGQEEARYRALARRHFGTDPVVDFAGAKRPDAVKLEYAACDVFCLPSRQEAFGIVFVEAMATGRPVVGTMASALPEVVGDGGVLVPPRDPGALAEALIELLKSERLRAEYAARGRARAERFTWAEAARQFGGLLASL